MKNEALDFPALGLIGGQATAVAPSSNVVPIRRREHGELLDQILQAHSDLKRVFVYTITHDNEHVIKHNFDDTDTLIGVLERAQNALMAE